MRTPRSVLPAATAWLVCVLLVSCGGDSSKRAATPPKDAADAQRAEVAVEIAAPPDGKRLRARQTSGGAWLARG